MIPQISEINFPSYATLSQATVTLNDMGDKTISTQIKIDGGIAPDFSYDWEVEFQGERYIQPLREPQASKGNESICSMVDLTFYHKTIYDLKRYFFVEMTTTESGTAMADKYIADLSVNLGTFCEALQRVLDFYYEGNERIVIDLNSKWEYAQEPQYVQIQYTHIWDVVQKIYDLFGVRWSIEGRTLRIGYPTEEVAHTFEYGFEGGLLKVERQVQSADIRNSLLGRGGSKNLPYRYFKDTDPENPSFQADPDWIPELANIYFTELRGKTFRDYVKGWKAKHYGGEPMQEPTDAYTKGYTDTTFNPIEYVEDKESIAKYGLLQGGLENQEDIYPTIQGVEVDGLGRIDEVVEVEQVLVDDVGDAIPNSINKDSNYAELSKSGVAKGTKSIIVEITSPAFKIPIGFKGTMADISSDAYVNFWYNKTYYYADGNKLDYRDNINNRRLSSRVVNAHLYYASDNSEVVDIVNLMSDTPYYYVAEVEVYDGFPQDEDNRSTLPNGVTVGDVVVVDNSFTINVSTSWQTNSTNIPSLVVGNYVDGIEHIYREIEDVEKDKEVSIDINSESFTIPEGGATMIDAPIRIIATNNEGKKIDGTYEWEKNVKLVNTETNEVVSSINIPQGEYYARVNVRIKNAYTSDADYRIELLPFYVYFPIDTAQWQPTFNIWVKNIWNTTRNEGESAETYAERVWQPILGDREGNEAKVVFTTGWLSGHSDYEFSIVDVAYSNDVPNAEWRLTLAKSDVELEATGVYIPSTKQNAKAGDYFFFIGIDMPHQYILWAEERLDNYKRDQLLDTAHIKPTWVVQTDKVRLNQLQEGESELLLNAFKVGNAIRLADTRFIEGVYEKLYLQSVTYTWGTDVNLLPDVEVVLSDKVTTVTNPVQQIQGEIDTLAKQVGSISNVQQIIRAIGDKLYLRKDGIEDFCKSPIKFLQSISSKDFAQGIIGGKGWSVYTDDEGNAIIECDVIKARQELEVNNIISNQVVAVGGKQIESAASIVCSQVEATSDGFVCYFDTHNGSVHNLFQVGDVAYSQLFSPDNVQTKSYKREVIAVGANSITLSLEGNGNGLPQVGDVIIHYGSTTDTNRQYVIIRDVVGGGYERMVSGLNSVSASGEEYYFAGRLNNDTPRWFVGDKAKQYIEYKDGELRIVANVTLGADTDLSSVEQFKKVQGDVTNLTDASVFTSVDLVALQTEHDKVVVEHNDIIYRCNEYGIDYQQDYEYIQPAEAYIDSLARTIAKLEKGENVSSSEINENREAFYKALNEILPVLSDVISVEIGSANDKVDDLDYLKQVFPNAILDVNGASLAQLLGVKDTANNVVAGLYGGADDELNDSGFVDSTKGILMFFAGAKTLQDVAQAATRIYQDGTLETNKIVANGGKLGVFEIDPNNGYQLKSIEDGSTMELRGKGIAFTSDAMQLAIRSNVGGNVIYPLTISNQTQNAGGTNAGISIYVGGATGNDLMGNNVALLIGKGDISVQSGVYRGFRPKVRIVTKSETLSPFDNIICTNNTNGAITLKLPSSPEDSQMYVIRRLQSDKQSNSDVRVDGNGAKIITHHLAEAKDISDVIAYNNAMVLHYIGVINGTKYWIANFMTYM